MSMDANMPGAPGSRWQVGEIYLPEDPRAVRLFRQLESDFERFITSLPPPIRSLVRRRSTFAGKDDEQPFKGLSDLNPVLAGTPWLFWGISRYLDDKVFKQIAAAGALYVLASVVLDHLVDGQVQHPAPHALLQQALYDGAVTRYRSVFPPGSQFWGQFERLAADHRAGLALEVSIQAKPRFVSEAEYQAMASAKVSPIITTLAAISIALERPGLLDPLEVSLKHIAIASQMLDDLGDWRQDLSAGHLTGFLARLGSTERWRHGRFPSEEEFAGWIDHQWADVTCLREVMAGLNACLRAVEGLDCPQWVGYVNGYRALVDGHLTRFTARHLLRVLQPLVAGATGDQLSDN